MSNDKFKIVPMNEAVAEFEGKDPVMPKNMDTDIQDLPITEFRCHLTDRDKARKHLQTMAATIYDPEVKDMVANIPLYTNSGIVKNTIVAVSEDIAVFQINMKTGRMLHV